RRHCHQSERSLRWRDGDDRETGRRNGRDESAGRQGPAMNVGALAVRHARAAALVAGALVVSGAIAAFALPSSIYPPLEFPRIAIIAHSGTLPPQSMMLTVARPIETAVMEVPGIRRVRSRSIRAAAEISAQLAP